MSAGPQGLGGKELTLMARRRATISMPVTGSAAVGFVITDGTALDSLILAIQERSDQTHPCLTSGGNSLTFTVTDHNGASCMLGATNQAAPLLLRLDAVGWALMSVASIISTSGSGASGESGGSAASDADNSEKIRSKTPLSHQRRQRL